MSSGRLDPSRIGGDADALYPRLVADIGGTNVRFGLLRTAAGDIADVATLRCADFAGPAEAARAYLAKLGNPQPRLAAFAVATAVEGDQVNLTNSAWSFSRTGVEADLGLDGLLLLNDFEALALALPRLKPAHYRNWGRVAPEQHQAMAVIGPGTGLGVAGCIPTAAGWVAVPGEGGHVTVAAGDAFEADVIAAARAEFAHVSAERLLSGIGLPVLHQAVARVLGQPAAELTAEDISHQGVAGSDATCAATMETFCALLGAFAGNAALTLGARGAVFVGGGIVPKLGEFFFRSRFRERFEAKGRFHAYLAAIPTAVIHAPHPALDGAAEAIESALRLLEHGFTAP